jgi:imidazolonepropionase-like amidohydrolase
MVKGTAAAYELAKKHGVKVAWGTDILFSPDTTSTQSYMVTLLEKYFGYTPFESLKMVTHDNAQLLKLAGLRDPYPNDLGVVAEGAYADLIIVDGNPLEDISLITDPDKAFDLIMKDGVIYKNDLD